MVQKRHRKTQKRLNSFQSGLTGRAVLTPNAVVNIEQTGSNDYTGLLRSYTGLEILKARLYDLELMLKAVMDLEAETGNLLVQ